MKKKKKKSTVSKMVIFSKRPFGKKVISFNGYFVWQVWLEKAAGKVALAQGKVQQGPQVLVTPTSSTPSGFLRAPLTSRAVCVSVGISNLSCSCQGKREGERSKNTAQEQPEGEVVDGPVNLMQSKAWKRPWKGSDD